MIKDLFKNYIYPVTVFAGGMIGVGFLSLPYVALQAGIWITAVYFIVLTALVLLINYIFCQISLQTPDFKRFPGFVGHHLGKWPQVFTTVVVAFGTFGVLLAYIVVGSQFLTAVFQPMFSGSNLLYAFIYFCLVSVIVYFDIKIIAKVEFWIIAFLFLSIFFIFINNFSQINLGNIFVHTQIGLSNIFLPYGPILFALWGIGLIPELEEMMVENKQRLKRVATIATVGVSMFYFLFILLVLGICGAHTDEMALTGLKNFLSSGLVSVALFVGALATFTAFIAQGIVFKKVLMYDLGIKHWQAFVVTCFTPMILFLLGLKSFLPIISLIGGVVLGIDGILILLMYKKIGGKKIIIYPLSLVFLFGVIYEIIYFIK